MTVFNSVLSTAVKATATVSGTALLAVALSTSIISASANAYNVGDTVSPTIIRQLNIDPNKVTLVDFFASWCTSCKRELPILDNMTLDSSKVVIIGVDTDKDVAKGRAFRRGLNLDMKVYEDPSQSIIGEFKPFGMPALYYIQNGKVVKIRQGALPHIDDKVNADLDALL